MTEDSIRFPVDGAGEVSGLLTAGRAPRSCFVLAHGAGAGMRHAFMAAVGEGLAARNMASFRYQFPYMEKGGKRPDRPPLAQATVRAAVAEAARLMPGTPLFAGGKSFGGRMTSQAQAVAPLPDVRGLVFLGFPLHAAGKPSSERGDHLKQIEVPMLFLQGAKDRLAELPLLEPLIGELAAPTLHVVPDADHSFHVPKRSGRTDTEVMAELMEKIVAWAAPLL